MAARRAAEFSIDKDISGYYALSKLDDFIQQSFLTPSEVPNNPVEPSTGDPYFRRMMKWVFIALFVVLAVAIVVVEVTLRLFGQ
jgi:hypothetical protein